MNLDFDPTDPLEPADLFRTHKERRMARLRRRRRHRRNRDDAKPRHFTRQTDAGHWVGGLHYAAGVTAEVTNAVSTETGAEAIAERLASNPYFP